MSSPASRAESIFHVFLKEITSTFIASLVNTIQTVMTYMDISVYYGHGFFGIVGVAFIAIEIVSVTATGTDVDCITSAVIDRVRVTEILIAFIATL